MSLGAYLQGIRQEQGKTIEEVAAQIFIRPALLRALESGDEELLPEPIFIQGFIRRYADLLGLDGNEVTHQFEPTPVAVLPDPSLANGEVEGVVSKQDKHGLKVLSKANAQSPPVKRFSSRKVWMFLGSAILAIAVIGGGLWLLTQLGDQAESETTDTSNPDAPESASSPDQIAATTASPTPTAASPLTVTVTLTEDSWMRVRVDGETAYEGILTGGTEQSWSAQEEVLLNAGNAGAVQVSLNGAPAQPLGDPGAVQRLRLTPETDPASLATP